MTKPRERPSGDQASAPGGRCSPAIRADGPPPAARTWISGAPSFGLKMKAMRVPSGDHSAPQASPAGSLNGVWAPLRGSTSQIDLRPVSVMMSLLVRT